MDQNLLRPDLLPPAVPTAALWALTLLTLAVWILVHLAVARRGLRARIRFALCIPAGTVACWSLFQLLARHLFLSTRWHLLFAALLTACAMEAVSALYRREAGTVHRAWHRRGIVACRMGAVGIVLFMLLQPILVGEKTRTIRRRVVVLADDSASMHFRDRYWTDAERFDVAQALGLMATGGRPARLSTLVEDLAAWRKRMATLRQVAQERPAEVPRADIRKAGEQAREAWTRIADDMEAIAKTLDASHTDLISMLPRVAAFIRQRLLTDCAAVAETAGRDNASAQDIAGTLARIDGDFAYLEPISPQLQQAGTLELLDAFTPEKRDLVLKASDDTRAAISRKLLTDKLWHGKSALQLLSDDYDVSVYRFGAKAEPDPELRHWGSGAAADATSAEAAVGGGDTDADGASAAVAAFRAETDFTTALEQALKDVPFEELAGFLILTDGRHNGDAGTDAVARRLGGSNIPVHTIVVGGSRPPSDIAVANAAAPESLFLGDKLRISGSVSATGFFNRSAKLSLYLGEELIEEETVLVKSEDFAQEFRFTHVPAEKGVLRYRIVIETLDGDEFPDNNEWPLDVSVMDDRTNVLLVDSRPRWEFRYLRNLFYGRDKSVHLQEYLIHPDRVAGQPTDPLPPADTARKFGDSESGSFPVDRAAWSKFDVIILGDLSEEVLTPEVVSSLRYCVEQRGALLVSIAGPQHFPHAIRNPELLSLLPIECEPSDAGDLESPESAFHFRLAPSGRTHPAMLQSTSSYENDQIWNDLPEMYWRHSVTGVKPGSEVLAYAEPADAPEMSLMARDTARLLDEDPESALALMRQLREMQQNNALIAVRNLGRGKVLQLMTDNTWRLRYRIGDTRHHRFWGQVLRWGAGEKLRAGNLFARIGTDQLRYTPSDPVVVQARFQDLEFQALNSLSPEVYITDETGREIRSIRLKYREDSNGFYEGELPPFPEPGTYVAHLRCPEAGRILGDEWPEVSEAQFIVVTSRRPAEFVQIAASWDTPRRMASVSGGSALPPSRMEEALNGFGQGNRILHERTETYLWDHWLLFTLLIALLTTEWLLRKKVALP